MTKRNSEEKKIPHPFSENFIPHWEKWKAFKKEQFKFDYKPIGEEGALTKLYRLSGGDEKIALLIIEEAIANGWKGHFALKQDYNGAANKSNPTNSNSANQRQGTSGSRIQAAKDY